PHIRKVTVPYLMRIFRQGNAADLSPPLGIEKAQFDLFGMGRENGDIDAGPVPGGAERIWKASIYAQVGNPCHEAPASTTAPNGGSLKLAEAGRPCHGSSVAVTVPLTTPEPP